MSWNTKLWITWAAVLSIVVLGGKTYDGWGDARPSQISPAAWAELTPTERDAYVRGIQFADEYAQQIADEYGINLDEPDPSTSDENPTTPPVYSSEVVREPMTAEKLDAALDPNGRPYDPPGASNWGDDVAVARATELVAPGGEVLVVNAFDLYFGTTEYEPVELTFGTDVLDVIRHTELYVEGWTALFAVEISVPGSEVETWARTETAYFDAGGVVTAASIDNGFVVDTEAAFEPWFEDGFAAENLDGEPGVDALMISVAGEDGRYLMSRGFDRTGAFVSVVIFDQRYPWRLAFSQGSPPPDITQREDEMAECLAGERDVTVSYRDGVESFRWCQTSELGEPSG